MIKRRVRALKHFCNIVENGTRTLREFLSDHTDNNEAVFWLLCIERSGCESFEDLIEEASYLTTENYAMELYE